MRELSRERRYLVLANCCLSLFVAGMDVTIVNVALPSPPRRQAPRGRRDGHAAFGTGRRGPGARTGCAGRDLGPHG
jgi:hypothetical protein